MVNEDRERGRPEGERKRRSQWERLTSARDNCRDTQNAEPLEPIFRMWKEEERRQGERRRVSRGVNEAEMWGGGGWRTVRETLVVRQRAGAK